MARYETPEQAMDARVAAGPVAVEQARREAEEARRLANLDREQEARQRLAAARERKANRPNPPNGKRSTTRVPAGSKTLRARYNGKCPNCELPIRKGEWIFLRPARHEDCVAAIRAQHERRRAARQRAEQAGLECDGLTGRELASCLAQRPPKPLHTQPRRAPRMRSGRAVFATSRRAVPSGRR